MCAVHGKFDPRQMYAIFYKIYQFFKKIHSNTETYTNLITFAFCKIMGRTSTKHTPDGQ